MGRPNNSFHDGSVKELEHLRQHHLSPDLSDLGARLERTKRRRKRWAMAVGLGGTTLVIVIVAATIGLVGNDVGRHPLGGQTPPVAGALPNGKLLLQDDETASILASGDNHVSRLGAYEAYGFSPDGTQVLATTERTFNYSGTPGTDSNVSSTFQRSLVLIEVNGGEQREIVSMPDNEGLTGPISWSPDGSRIAYGLATFGRGVSEGPSSPGVQTAQVCVITAEGTQNQCLAQADSVSYFSWGPSGDDIAVQQTGDHPILSWNLSSGSVDTLVPAGGGKALNDALHSKGLGSAQAILFPAWSPSGSYLAVLAQSVPGGSVPVILASDGSVAAMGTANDGEQFMQWQPTSDVLAYTVGRYFPATGSGVETISPDQSHPSLVLSEEGLSDPYIQALAWSPDGETLAVTHARGPIQLVPIPSNGQAATLSQEGTRGLLVDWGR